MDNVEKFVSKVSKLSGGCWQWNASKDRQGYGWCWFVPGTARAHRASYLLFKGDIPEGMIVMHECDNPSCVNPEHLSLGTQAENQAQKFDRKLLLGECNKVTKLSSEQVLAIYRDSRPQAAIAKEYDVFQGTIAAIKLGQRWGNVTGHKKEKPGHFSGMRAYQAKLTLAQVLTLRDPDSNVSALAREYGVSVATAFKAANRQTYRDIT